MNKKRVLKLLMLFSLALVFLLKPAMMSGAVPADHASTLSHSAPDKKKTVRKQRALSVLREYLPAYADILEAEIVRFEKVFYNGGSALPVSDSYDPRSPFVNPIMRLQLMQTIDKWLGTRYRYGGRSVRGIDCSGFTSKVYTEALGKAFNGSSRMQARQFSAIFDVDSMQFGDVIFFSGTNRRSKRIGHVGIYLGRGVFAHASTSRGVTFNHIEDGYYEQRFRFGGRFMNEQANDAEKAGIFASP